MPPPAHAADEYEKGRLYFDADDLTGARIVWQPLARDGHVRSIAGLNQMYYLKGGTEAEIAEATLFTQRAAAREGAWEALIELAILHWRGHGVPRNLAKGAELLEQAMAVGGGPALYRVGAMYEGGAVVPRDTPHALDLYVRSAASGEPAAAMALGDAYLEGRGVPKDLPTSYMWFDVAGALQPSGEMRNEARRARDYVGQFLTAEQAAGARRRAQAFRGE